MVATLFLRQFLINLLVPANVLILEKKMKKLIYFNILGDISLKLIICFAKGIQDTEKN